MWRNLAKVQSTIQVIGNAVAPAFGSDDDEEEDDEEEEEYEYYDENQDQDQDGGEGAAAGGEWDDSSSHHQQQHPYHRTPYHGPTTGPAGSHDATADEEDDDIHSQVEFFGAGGSSSGGGGDRSPSPWTNPGGLHGVVDGSPPLRRTRGDRGGRGGGSGPLGLVGFLAHALDASQRDNDDSSSRRWRGDNKDGNDDEGRDLRLEPKVEQVHSTHLDQTVPPPTTTSAPWKEELLNGERAASAALPPPWEDDWRATPPRDGSKTATGALSPPLGGAAGNDHDPPPRRFSLVRESGSVSPYGSPQSVRSVSRSDKAVLLPVLLEGSGRGMEQEPTPASPPPAPSRLPSPRPTVQDTSPRMVQHRWSPPPPDAAHASPVRTEPSLPSDEPPSQPSPTLPLSQPSLPPTATALAADATRFPRPPPAIVPPMTALSPFSSQKNALQSDGNRTVERELPGILPAPPFAPPTAEPLPLPAVTDSWSNGSSATANNNNFIIAAAPPKNNSGSSEPAAGALAAAPSPSARVDDSGAVAGEALPLPIPPPPPSEDSPTQLLERRCRDLEQQLAQSQDQCRRLEGEREAALASATAASAAEAAQEQGVSDDHDRELLLKNFQQKESRLLAAAAEDREREVRAAQLEGEARVQSLHHELEHEREVFARERECLEQLVADAQARAERAERHLQRDQAQRDQAAAQHQKQLQRELQMSADQLAQTMALLDEREEQVTQLKALVQSLQSRLNEHAEGAQLAEDEVEELHHENEELRQRTQHLEGKCSELRSAVEQLQSDSTKLSEVKLELRMLREERDRERAKNESETAHAHGSRAQIEEERDEALAEVQDLQQQLAAARADLEIAKTDTERVMMARGNLQIALESFQSEREAELAMWEEQRRNSELALAAAHAAALEALRETNHAHVREIQQAADASVRHAMDEIQRLEAQVQSFRVENVQMRRSLDEAIHQLQATQEDVIDRTLMKNILMDWLTKSGSKERRDVLELMASVLHFTEDEKERVHIGPHAGALEKVVHTVAAPLPPSKADLEHLAGDTVREKWINFLMAETDDD